MGADGCADRKLALKLHPDKCTAPGSDEAFKGAPPLACTSYQSIRNTYVLVLVHFMHCYSMFCMA